MTTAFAESRKIKYIATVNDEALPESTDPGWEMEYIDIGNVEAGAGITGTAVYRFEDAPSRARRLVRHGDVIVSTVRTYLQAIAAIIDPPTNLIVSTGFAVIRPLREKLDPGFCRYALREPSFLAEVERRSVGVSYPAINSSDLAAIRIPFPPLPRQRAIAAYLDRETAKIDAMIAAKEQLLTLLAEKRRAVITHAVTRGLNEGGPMKDSGVEWLGEIPVHWDRCHLRRVLSSSTYGISASAGPEGEIPMLRMGDIVDGEIEYSKLAFVDSVDPELQLQVGDLLFNRTNSLDQIGKVGLVRSPDQFPCTFASYLVRLRVNDRALPEFLHLLLNSTYSLSWARGEAIPAIGQANLNPFRYGYLQIPVPSTDEQRRIVAYCDTETTRIDSITRSTRATLSLLTERRSALIAAAVTGQIDVEDAA